ncbi:MAG: hypothetical protein EP305_03815 [Bacteroidetes bacterium]|nr:MAG: hypothetical protein EP305_03815 [Bacteroidota bacterium]
MKRLLLASLLFCFAAQAQFNNDRPTSFADLSIGVSHLQYNSYENVSGFYGTNYTMNEWVYHSTEFELTNRQANALDFVLHYGYHAPFKVWRYASIGMEIKGGIGFRKQLGEVYVSDYPEVDDRISIDMRGISLDAPIEIYYLRSMGDYYYGLSAGYKFYKDYYSFSTPIIGASVQTGKFRFQIWTNLLQKKKYREYSDGTLEWNRALYIGGVNMAYFFK